MVKKCLLLFWLISINFIISASVWDDIANCISDPCNCGQPQITEHWGNNPDNSFNTDALCPPYNKDDGRENNGNNCLLQYDYPSAFAPLYMKHCAQSTAESTYFAPKIEIRAQNCNSFACWTQDTSLNWDGQCVVWPTGWGLPTLRVCARLAMPANPLTGAPADPGYTKGLHLNQEGFEEPDKVIYGVDGRAIAFDKPKLCAYRDPWLLDLTNVDGIPNVDLLDFNPLSQPMHHTAGVHPIAKVMMFLATTVFKGSNPDPASMVDMLGTIFSNIGDSVAPGLGSLATNGMSIFKKILGVLDKIVAFRNGIWLSVITAVGNEFGQFNRSVDSYHFGCVEIPLGPYPPPFCPTLASFVPTASVQTICPLDASSWLPVKSTTNNPCVISNLVNNSVSNSARVTLDNFLPLCSPAQTASGIASDKCVILNNLGPLASASVIHAITSRKDVIKPCNKAANGQLCAATTVPFSCSVSRNGCQDGFRIVYGTQVGTQLVPSGYYNDDLSDCGVGTTSNCQKIWGINTGEYVDISLSYPPIEIGNSATPLVSSNLSLNYIQVDPVTGNSSTDNVTFYADIVRQTAANVSGYNLTQTPFMMCVFTENSSSGPGYLAGCVNRMPAPKIKVYDCNSDFAKSNNFTCNNSFYQPGLIGSIQDGQGRVNSTSAVFEALTVKNANNNTAYQINLAGSNYLAFATDDTYVMKPFTGIHSTNPSTIYGTYQNDIPPYDSQGNVNKNAVYLTGLEYINGKYIDGGTKVCLQDLDMVHCPDDTTNCILSKLVNSNIVYCSDFFNKTTQYNNLKLCSNSESNCSDIDSLPGKNGGPGIKIKKCDSGFCYTNINNVEVCKVSLKPSDRYMPTDVSNGEYYNVNSNSVGDDSITVSNKDNSYSVSNNATGLNYDKDLYVLRDKTPYELGDCVSIPQLQCPAITNPGPDDGNASWPQTTAGTVAQGSCVQNGKNNSLQSLTRYCISNVDTGKASFAPLKPGVGCTVSAINLSTIDTNVPGFVTPQTNSNDNGRSGFVQVNKDHWDNSEKFSVGEYYSNLTFNVQNVRAIDYFQITQLAYDDYVLIKVNGKKVLSGPWNFNTLSYSNGQALIDGTSQGDQKGFRDNNFNFSLVPYLVEGTNTIEIKVVVYDVGTMAYLIEYKMK